jgi:iron-sulfur cluster repair protein YtfE (RIC family)
MHDDISPIMGTTARATFLVRAMGKAHHSRQKESEMEATVPLVNSLKADYQAVRDRLNDVERVIGSLAEPRTILDDLQALRSFFKQDIWALVWKEEDVLFPEVGRSAPREKRLFRRMLADHKSLRKVHERFQNGVDSYLGEPSNEQAIASLRENGQQIVDLLRDHILEESSVLEAAVACMDEAQSWRIHERFEVIDADLAWAFEQLEGFYP